MVDENQIKRWLEDGTINQAQAKKMLTDSSKEESKSKLNKFIMLVSTIGVILIFIGFFWLIARNWHQIPDFMKLFILVGSTLAIFVSGIISRQRRYELVGRVLITLGALLYILDLFLISEIFNLRIGSEHILLFAWTIILITAYFLDSKENLVVAILTFFLWALLQYSNSVSKVSLDSSGNPILGGYILIFLGGGALLFGLSTLHNSLKHRFTNVYRFWTVFYFLLIFFILSFQSFLPFLSEFSFEGKIFSLFLVLFIILCFFGFIIGTLIATSKRSVSIKEIIGFIGILAILFTLILAAKVGEGQMGDCNAKSCKEYRTSQECSLAPPSLQCQSGSCANKISDCWNLKSESECTSKQICQWSSNGCNTIQCQFINTESECTSKQICQWSSNRCLSINCNSFKTNLICENNALCIWNSNVCLSKNYRAYHDSGINQDCEEYDNQRDSCVNQELCKWKTSFKFTGSSKELPTSLWFLWIVNNIALIGFIILILWYGQRVGSTKIVNLALFVFVIEVITRYIGFFSQMSGYLVYSVLSIFGGVLLVFGAWLIPKWRRKLISKTKQPRNEFQ